eukprot:9207606-Alexandrium_andersonii.AAC.1
MGLHQACQSGKRDSSGEFVHIVAEICGVNLASAGAALVSVRCSTQAGDDDSHPVRVFRVR